MALVAASAAERCFAVGQPSVCRIVIKAGNMGRPDIVSTPAGDRLEDGNLVRQAFWHSHVGPVVAPRPQAPRSYERPPGNRQVQRERAGREMAPRRACASGDE